MKILVTGGAGFIGSYLVEALIRARYQVLVVSDGARGSVPQPARFLKLDVLSPKLRAALVNFAPEYVCHLAAQPSVQNSINDPVHDAEVNIVGSLNVIESARAAHVRKLLFVSSAAVYGEAKELPTTEQALLQPASPYALAKVTVERYLEYFSTIGLQNVVVRPSNVYGPRQRSGSESVVVGDFARLVLAGRAIELPGRGTQTRDFIYVTDVAEAMVKALESGHGVYNLSSGIEVSLRELAVALGEVAGVVPRVSYAAAPVGELAHSCLDARRAHKELGWEPKVPLIDGLRQTLKWQRDLGINL